MCPDYGGPEFEAIRMVLTNAGGMNNEQVIQHLADAWTQQKNCWLEAWEQQVQDDLRAQEEAECQQCKEEDEQRALKEVEEEGEK